ncbi:MAG: hypothetical protein WD250_15070 [Egibacteraceae bacterium]
MHRRALLKSVGYAAGTVLAGGVLAACGQEDGADDEQPSSDAPAGRSSTQTTGGEEQTLTVVNASFETLAGTDQRFAFGVVSADNVPVLDAELDVRLRDPDGNELAGPFPATFVDTGGPLGVYHTRIDVPDPGPVIVVVRDGDDIGELAVDVIAPEDSALAVPGQDATAVATPTVEDAMGMEELCTQQPDDCGMHEVSLEQALADGRPVALVFATPAYCQTAACGPAVADLDEIRQDGDWDDVAFIHVEIYEDAGQTVAAPVEAWDLPSEPWLFTIDRDGAIVDRLGSVLIPDEMQDMLTALA